MKYQTSSMLSENISKTDEGFLICRNVPLARPGELIYAKHELPTFEAENDRIIATRDAEDILSPETMASFEGKTLSYLHPKEQEINATNWKTHAIGSIFNVRAGDGQNINLLVGDVLVQDAEAVNAVMNRGLREVSLGYEALYTQEGKGRVRQRSIKGNHVALVPRGRCGALCAIQDHAAFLPENEPMSAKDKLIAFFTKAVNDGALDLDEEKQTTVSNDAKVDGLQKTVGDLTTAISGIVGTLKTVTDSLEDIKKAKKEETVDAETEEEKLAREKQEKEAKVADAETFSLAEILAPGVQNSADVKVQALKKAVKTADGKVAIEVFTSGKEVDYNSPSAVDVAFYGAANLLKASRTTDNAATKSVTIDQLSIYNPKADTPAVVQARFDEHWKKQA